MTTVLPSQAEPPLILAIDIGTSSVRALLFDARARAVDSVAAQIAYQIHASDDGAAYDDPDQAIERIAGCIDMALAQAGPLAQAIGAVAFDSLVTNMLAVDAQGQPLMPLLTYADTRATADSAALRQQLDERAAHERTGCLLRASYWPARLAWLRRTQPDLWRRAARWLTLGEYFEQRLFGQSHVSYSVASWSGLLDRRRLAWDAALLEALGDSPARLGALADLDAPLSGLREPYAQRWPALRALPWYPAIGDGAAANIGSGCIDSSRTAITVGTTGAMRMVYRELDSVPAGLWCYRVDGQQALLGGATSEGGNLYAWLRATLQLPEPAQIERQLAEMPPDGHGLSILPFLAGERSPGWAGDARATISGLTQATTPIQIVQAGLESIAYRFAQIDERIRGQGGGATQLIASGGALLSSPVWMQIFADVLGRELVASAEPEATSRGVALLALRSLGTIAGLGELPAATGATYAPDLARHSQYQAAVQRQRQLYSALIAGS